jgi:hypothetical protein
VADIGGARRPPGWARVVEGRLDSPWTLERVSIERARLLRRMGRHEESAAMWHDLTAGKGSVAIHAWIEVAKLREHRLGDVPGAIAATERAATLAERRRALGLGDPPTERAVRVRLDRLRGRTETALRRAGGAITQGVPVVPPRSSDDRVGAG